MIEDRIERQPPESERTVADLYPADKPAAKLHPMQDDFRVPKRRRKNPSDKLTAEEFERERLRQIRRSDSWMARGRGY